ncbi:hypothetical protein J6590_084686 [Homalodisca vitripennis]|nr:hypothetical protein J6590_084686 [Homalodisca vitripennis]
MKMSHRKLWLADELTEDVLLAEIPIGGSCDEGLSDNVLEGNSISSILTEIPILIDENTEVILEDDPILSQGKCRSLPAPQDGALVIGVLRELYGFGDLLQGVSGGILGGVVGEGGFERGVFGDYDNDDYLSRVGLAAGLLN